MTSENRQIELNFVVLACHAVTGTTAATLTWVIIPNGEMGLEGHSLCLCICKE